MSFQYSLHRSVQGYAFYCTSPLFISRPSRSERNERK